MSNNTINVKLGHCFAKQTTLHFQRQKKAAAVIKALPDLPNEGD